MVLLMFRFFPHTLPRPNADGAERYALISSWLQKDAGAKREGIFPYIAHYLSVAFYARMRMRARSSDRMWGCMAGERWEAFADGHNGSMPNGLKYAVAPE